MKKGCKRMRIVYVFFFSLLVIFLSSCGLSDVLDKAGANGYNNYDIIGLEPEPSESESDEEEIDNVNEEEIINDNVEEDIKNDFGDIEPIPEENEIVSDLNNEPVEEVIIEETAEEGPEPELSVITYTYSDADKTVYATLNLNVRSGPSVDFDIIGTFTNNGEIHVTGICNETGWYQVDYNGSTGYCDSNYTTDSVVTITADNNTATDNGNANTESSNTVSVGSGIVSAGDSGVSSYYVSLVQNAFYSLPQWVQNSFVNNGWYVYVRSGSWWYDYGWSMQLKGLTHYVNHAIYISGHDDSADYHTLTHEMGHYVDWINGQPSHFSEFSNIYNSEYRQFCNYYSYSNGYPGAEELFAEGIYHYWTDPGTLANVAPQTYNYIKNILG